LDCILFGFDLKKKETARRLRKFYLPEVPQAQLGPQRQTLQEQPGLLSSF
jgi:hypothetical protein